MTINSLVSYSKIDRNVQNKVKYKIVNRSKLNDSLTPGYLHENTHIHILIKEFIYFFLNISIFFLCQRHRPTTDFITPLNNKYYFFY